MCVCVCVLACLLSGLGRGFRSGADPPTRSSCPPLPPWERHEGADEVHPRRGRRDRRRIRTPHVFAFQSWGWGGARKAVDGLAWHTGIYAGSPRKGLHPASARGRTTRFPLGAPLAYNTPFSPLTQQPLRGIPPIIHVTSLAATATGTCLWCGGYASIC